MGTAHGKKVKPMNNLKPGGGNKLQPYISAGNGKKAVSIQIELKYIMLQVNLMLITNY